jgi:hypothetical protein
MPQPRPQRPMTKRGQPVTPAHYWHRDPHYWCWKRRHWDWYDYDWYDYDWYDWGDYDYDHDWDFYAAPRPQPNARPPKNMQYIKIAPPLMLGLLEYSRTQSASETESQTMLNNMLSMAGSVLDMSDYESITGVPVPASKPASEKQ